MAYKSKYSGEEVEGLLDKVNDGGTGEGITEINVEGTTPLNLEATIAGSLATITGDIDKASADNYGVVKLGGIIEINSSYDDRVISPQSITYDNGNSLYCYEVGSSNEKFSNFSVDCITVSTNWGPVLKLPVLNNFSSVKYVFGCGDDDTVYRIPISLFTQEG